MSKPIVVGYDGSSASEVALRWAVQAAADHRIPLDILVTWSAPGLTIGVGMGASSGAEIAEELRSDADETLVKAMDHAAKLDPGLGDLRVSGEVLVSAPAKALVERSAQAEMIVVGSHGRSGLSATLLGSVSRQVVAHAKCPVVVARAPADPGAKLVVVGIDGSSPSVKALDFAFDCASRSGQGLLVIHAWEVPAIASTRAAPTFTAHDVMMDVQGSEARTAAEVVAGYGEHYPDVHVRQEVLHGHAARELVAASEHASLLVVGSRGHGGFVGLMVGSVSHAVSHHAKCSVAVVH